MKKHLKKQAYPADFSWKIHVFQQYVIYFQSSFTIEIYLIIIISIFRFVPFPCKVDWSFQRNFGHPMELVPVGVEPINSFGIRSGSRTTSNLHEIYKQGETGNIRPIS
jgi:hypothetical protein